MIIKVQNETPFQILTGAFTIGPSETGYDLQVGATPQDFATLFSVGANTTRMVTNVANGSYYRLKNNVGEVKVNWSRTCVTEGGSGSGASYTAGDYIDISGDIISVTGITPDAYLTSADTANFALSADVATLSAATVGKADAANTTANTVNHMFPKWNTQGIITGSTAQAQGSFVDVNDEFAGVFFTNTDKYDSSRKALKLFTPLSAGTAGDILVSTGGVPVWSAATFAQQSDLNTLSAATESAIATIPENPVQSLSIDTIWKGTQAEYDAITTKDPNTFYIIV